MLDIEFWRRQAVVFYFQISNVSLRITTLNVQNECENAIEYNFNRFHSHHFVMMQKTSHNNKRKHSDSYGIISRIVIWVFFIYFYNNQTQLRGSFRVKSSMIMQINNEFLLCYGIQYELSKWKTTLLTKNGVIIIAWG